MNNNNLPSTLHLKLFFEKKEIRRLTIPRPDSFFAFQQSLSKIYPQLYHPELLIRYLDEEQEMVRIGSELEWEEYLKTNSKQTLLRLHVAEGKSRQYFKDGPAQPLRSSLYEENKTARTTKPVDVSPSPQLTGGVMKVLASFFPNGKILPFNMPEWLAKVVKVENLGNNEVDLDVDIPAFLGLLHNRALSLIPSNNDEALSLFSQLLQIDPSDAIVLYNYACSLCHAGKLDEAYEALQKAVKQGYSDIPHTIQDPDLALLREKATEKFQGIIRLMLAQKNQAHKNENQEKLEKERIEKEKLEKERIEKERIEKERIEKEKLEKEKLEKEKLEKERIEKEKLEKERIEKERIEKEKLEKEKLEKEKFLQLQTNKEFKRLYLEYSSQLAMIKETGFKFDDEVILQIIAQYKGDVTKTIAHLLDL